MKIFLVAFRGTGGFDDPRYVEEAPLIKAGHVGLQFEDDPRIWGFHPTSEAEETAGGGEKLINLLKNHIAQPGRVYDDTEIFKRAYALNAEYAEPTQVIFITYELLEPVLKLT